jgi:isocitrate dehydrogenase (NAD+)
MLKHLGEADAADRVLSAVRTVIGKGEKVTYDVKRSVTGSTNGAVGTAAYADALIEAL